MSEPLWVTALMAGDSTPGRPRDAFAAELRVIADAIAPEQEFPGGGDLARMRWLVQKAIRNRLLDEADIAEASDD